MGKKTKQNFLTPAATVEPKKKKKKRFTLLVLDSLDEQILAKPKGHVDHMALHSLRLVLHSGVHSWQCLQQELISTVTGNSI